MSATTEALSKLISDKLAEQKNGWDLMLSQTVLVQGGGLTSKIKLLVPNDGPFEIGGLAIYAKGPVMANGRVPNAPFSGVAGAHQTDWPSGVQNAAGWDLADGGLLLTLTQGSNSRTWFDGPLDLALVARPGYSGISDNLFPLGGILQGNDYLDFRLQNNDTALVPTVSGSGVETCYHYVAVGLYGRKYTGLAV